MKYERFKGVSDLHKWLIHCILTFALSVSLIGCVASVGDECGTDTDCGQSLVCELSLPGGYCTRRDCRTDGCPNEALCISFDLDTHYCMRPCTGDGDCREDYTCVTDFGLHPFCNVDLSAGDLASRP